MTLEEAIKTIQVAVAEVEWNYPMEYAIAFETAIKALETVNRYQEEIERLKKILAEEEEKYKLCAKRFYKVGVKDFAERLKDYAEECKRNGYDGIGSQDIDDILKELAGDTK